MSRVKASIAVGDSLHRQAGLCTAPSCRVAREDRRAGVRRRVSFTTSNWMRYGRCASKVRGIAAESKKHKAWKRSARFPRSARFGPLYAGHSANPAPLPNQEAAMDYSGLGIETQQRRSPFCRRPARTSEEQISIRGLNRNCNHDLKNLFKARRSWLRANPVRSRSLHSIADKGIRPEMARLTLPGKLPPSC